METIRNSTLEHSQNMPISILRMDSQATYNVIDMGDNNNYTFKSLMVHK